MQIPENLNIDGKDLRTIKNKYREQEASIRVQNEESKCTKIIRGVRQGCVLSPDLFSLYSEIILRNINDMPGIKIGGRNVSNRRYADDTVLIAENEQDLQKLVTTVVEESNKLGLTLNSRETETMLITKSKETPKCIVKIEDEDLKDVEKFNHLGSVANIKRQE